MALRVAVRTGVVDRPGPRKSQVEAVPCLGGAAMVAAFTAAVLVSAVLGPAGGNIGLLAATLGLACVLTALGLLDDLRSLPIWPRLLVEAGAGLIVWALGMRVQPAGWPMALDAVLTMAWVVAITNAFNLLDNMDGLSAGVALLCSLGLALVAGLNGQAPTALLALGLAGCAAGFLPNNFFPARIYMGDAGSLFLGFVLAVSTLRLRAHAQIRLPVVVMVALMAVPLFDTCLVVVGRHRTGRPLLVGARDHTSHRLVALGLPVPWAVGAMYGATAATLGLALVMARSGVVGRWSLAGALALAALAAGRALLTVPLPPAAPTVAAGGSPAPILRRQR